MRSPQEGAEQSNAVLLGREESFLPTDVLIQKATCFRLVVLP